MENEGAENSAKDILENVGKARRHLRRERERLEEMRAALNYVSGYSMGLGVQDNTTRDISDRLIRVEKQEARARAAQLEFIDAKSRAGLLLNMLPLESITRGLLYRHYMMGQPWKKVRKETGYSSSSLVRLAKNGIEELDRKLESGASA